MGGDQRKTCPSIARLEALDLDEQADPEVGRHVDHCERCRHLIEEIRANARFLAEVVPQLREEKRKTRATFPDAGAIPGYEILSEIHRGGQGVVYEAFQIEANRKVAIKMLLWGALATERQRHRFEREIEIAGSFRHPNIVTLYETRTLPDRRLAFSMEYVQGVPIDAWAEAQLSESGTAAQVIRAKMRLLAKVCDAVEYAHQRGVIHRDLKPGNIFVDDDGEPRVLDFGVAKVPGAGPGETMTGEFVGTFAYASPEQVSGDPEQVDTRSDVYGLGVILYELLTGHPPYPVDGSVSEVIRNITTLEPEAPSGFNRSIGGEVDTIVLKALAKGVERRYQSAGALRQDLERYLAGEPIAAKHDSTWYLLRKVVRKHRLPVGIAVTFLLASLFFTVFIWVQRQETRRLLRNSNIERGRALVVADNAPAAEELLWHEHLCGDWNLAQIHRAGEEGRAGPADAYWALWELYEKQACLTTLYNPYTWVRFHPQDSTTLAVAMRNGSVELRHASSLRPKRVLCPPHLPTNFQFSPDGRYLATASPDSVRLWDVKSGRELRQFPVRRGDWRRMAFSRDRQRFAAGGEDGTVVLLDLDSGRVRRFPLPENHPIRCLTFGADGRTLFLTTRIAPQTVKRLRVAPEFALEEGYVASAWEISGVGVTPQGRHLAAGPSVKDFNQTVLWDLETGEELPFPTRLESGSAGIQAAVQGQSIVCFNREATSFVSTRSDHHGVYLWDLKNQVLQGFFQTQSTVLALDFSPHDETVALATEAGLVKIWDLGRPFTSLEGHTETVFAVAFSPTGERLVTASLKEVRIRDAKSGKVLETLGPGLPTSIASAAFRPETRQLAIGGHKEDPRIVLWDSDRGEVVQELEGHTGWVSAVRFDPSNPSILVSASGDGSVRVWDLESGEEIRALDMRHGSERPLFLHDLCFSSAGDLIVACGQRKGDIKTSNEAWLWVWEYPSGRLRHEGPGEGSLYRCVCLSPDDRVLAIGGEDEGIRLWEVKDSRLLRELEGHNTGIYSLCFDPSGKMLMSGSRGGVIHLWDVGSGQQLATLDLNLGRGIFTLAISPDGRRLVAGTAFGATPDELCILWDLRYYDRHIAGNLEYQIQRLESEGETVTHAAELREWAATVLAQP